MSDTVEIKPISARCKVCGGKLVNDWLRGVCVCENCGNKWDLSDMITDFADYSRVVEKIKRAHELLEDTDSSASAGQALVLFKSAESDCTRFNDAYGAELSAVCKKGKEQAGIIGHYAAAKSYFEKENYIKAHDEFKKAGGFKDSEEYLFKCDDGIKIQRKKRIPYAVIIGLVLPAVLTIVLHLKTGIDFWPCVAIFLASAAGAAYAVYLEGVLSIIIEILSFIVAVPLLLFLLLSYGFGMNITTASRISIGVPLLIVAVIAVLAERKQ